MKSASATLDELKFILANIRHPELLDDHPWANSLLARQWEFSGNPSDQTRRGIQLITAISALFRKSMPSTPPRRGKRLDTRWCQFGLLAAEYFAPFLYGTPYPSSLRDAWGRIDQVLPLFVFGKPGEDLPDDESLVYRLFDEAAEPTPVSTLSDWHTNGLQELANLFVSTEQYLSRTLSQPSPILNPARAAGPSKAAGGSKSGKRKHWIRTVWIVLLVTLLLILLSAGGYKGFQIYRAGKTVLADMNKVEIFMEGKPDISMLGQAAPLVSQTRQDVATLTTEVEPLLWTGKYLAWVPKYGGDLAQSQPLLEMANELLSAADEASQGGMPIWQEVYVQKSHPPLTEMSKLLVEAQPHLSNASQALNQAVENRKKLNVVALSPTIQSLITGKLDPVLPVLQDGLPFAMATPELVGASTAGPKTYLILFENEDELRATGGFLTAVGTVVVKDGDIVSFNVEDSYALDDLTKPYPPAPWQLQQYMDAQILLLRDSNWSPDFPTSAALAEYLYAYTRFHSADGIIALDQHAIQMLLTVLGPVNVDNVDYPVTSENVIDYMRSAKYQFGAAPFDPARRKDFIGILGEAILAQIKSRPDIPWEALVKVVAQAMNEKHILVQMDNPVAAAALANQGWDGALRPGPGDFLMTVDSNVGFTKSNAVVESQLSYDVDLSNLKAPVAQLKVTETNHATGNAPCKPLGVSANDYQDSINMCYWDYLRVYGPGGTQLQSATPHAIPAEWMLDGKSVPARVDTLNENIPGVQSFGTLLLVPVASSLETDFLFLLPARVVQMGAEPGSLIYALHVQKQPGTGANPIDICVHLPKGAVVVKGSLPGTLATGEWCLKSNLRTDLNLQLIFSISGGAVPDTGTATP